MKKTLKAPEKSANDWLADIMAERILSSAPDVVPEGWMTLKQMGKATGLSEAAMRVRVSRLIDSGRLQKKQFKVFTGHQITLAWHYYPTA